ncbi:MAG: T9SS type A sorting domain-containing protein [Bacteroidales bacterium]
MDPRDSDRVYAGTGSGLFLSMDGGSGWEEVSGLPETGVVRAIEFNPHNPHTLFVAVDQYGLYYSEDGGGSWNASVAGLEPNSSLREIIFVQEDTSIMYVCDLLSGVYRSDNRGSTWSMINTDLLNRAVTSLTITTDGQHLYASTSGAGVFRCDLNGEVPVSPGTGMRNIVPSVYPDFLVYPNPASEGFFISGGEEAWKIEVFNALGTLLYSEEGSLGIPFPGNPPGLYHVVIHTIPGQVFCRKVIIR